MRHLVEMPYGTMDFLFVQLMQWGRDQGYRWFNLGAAPHELSQLLQQLPSQFALQLQAVQLLTQLPAHLCRVGGQLRLGLRAP